MSVQVRRADENDIPGIVAIWGQFMELLRTTNRHYWEVKDGQDSFSRYLTGAVNKPEFLIAIAEDKNDGLVGFTLALIEALPEWFGSERIGLIRYMAVSEDHRSKGVGYEMVNFVMNWFRSQNIQRAELYVLYGLPASGFWEKIGFKKFMDRRFMKIE